jgi:para-nitrobenzyl esterase
MIGSMLGFDTIGDKSEDCLYLNVWTPGVDGARRPVMVWIHGGAFVIGSSSQAMYEAVALAARGDVVVVTVNYRLGVLGYLHVGELDGARHGATSNPGVLDQIAALEWVRDEIAAFGGDPTNVTVFGESAGAISVSALLAAPRARGLFQRAIVQSGSGNVVAEPEHAREVTDFLLRELDIERAGNGHGESDVIERLRATTAERILAAQQRITLTPWPKLTGTAFQPVVDGEVLPCSPFEAVRDGHARDVSLLAGVTRDEWNLFTLIDPGFRSLDETALERRCERNFPGMDDEGVLRSRRAIETYHRAHAARGASTTPQAIWCAIESDRVFRYPVTRLTELQSAHQPATYGYLFDWQSPLMNLGACHVLEIPFVFRTLNDPRLAKLTGTGEAVERLADAIQDAWIAFARSGDPSHAGIGTWPAYDRERRATMLLDAECRVVDAPLDDEHRFWESLSRPDGAQRPDGRRSAFAISPS